MKYSSFIKVIALLISVLILLVNVSPADSASATYNVIRWMVIVVTIALGGCVVGLIFKALVDTIKYIFVSGENKTTPKYNIYRQVPRTTATPIEAMHMVYNSFSIYKFEKMMVSEILNLNRKGIIIFENNEFNIENLIIVKMADLDEATCSNLTNVEQYIITILEQIFEGEELTLDVLIDRINFYITNIIKSSNRTRNTLNDASSKLFFDILKVVKKDLIVNNIFDEKKSKDNFNIVVRIGIFMITLAIPLFTYIALSASEALYKLFTLPFIWWHLLVLVGSFGFIASIFALFKKDDYTADGREERAKWKGFEKYLKSEEIFEDIKLNNNIVTEILPYLFVFDAPKKLINFVLDNMAESTIDMKAAKELYKLAM